jgi:hypothetical protein
MSSIEDLDGEKNSLPSSLDIQYAFPLQIRAGPTLIVHSNSSISPRQKAGHYMLPLLWFDIARYLLMLAFRGFVPYSRAITKISQLAFRETVAEYGTDLTFTPMVCPSL